MRLYNPEQPSEQTRLDDLVQRAMRYAINAHRRIDHRRKYSDQPYDAHLQAVAEIVASASDDPLCIAAAWLHDSVEDTPATFADIERHFGLELTQLVRELTDISRPSDGNRATRKAIDLRHLAEASPRAKTVKLADLIDNCQDICKQDTRFAKVYLLEARALLGILQTGHPQLLKRAHRELEKCAQRLGIAPPGPSAHPGDAIPHDRTSFPIGQRRVLRLFVEAFTAKDIAEPLRSFDSHSDAARVREILQNHQLSVAGLREDGQIVCYTRRSDIDQGMHDLPQRAFRKDQVISADASLSDVILVLTRYDHCFVTLLEHVDAVITRTDIQKPVARMWLFGIITMTEMDLGERIRAHWPDGSWCQLISRGRLQKAELLFEERRRRNQHSDLVDCLQISDKLQLLTRDDESLRKMGFSSRAAAKKVAREFESLRNNLAHAQDIVTHDWPQIARMTQRIEQLANQ
jgi:hypothetical protein